MGADPDRPSTGLRWKIQSAKSSAVNSCQTVLTRFGHFHFQTVCSSPFCSRPRLCAVLLSLSHSFSANDHFQMSQRSSRAGSPYSFDDLTDTEDPILVEFGGQFCFH